MQSSCNQPATNVNACPMHPRDPSGPSESGKDAGHAMRASNSTQNTTGAQGSQSAELSTGTSAQLRQSCPAPLSSSECEVLHRRTTPFPMQRHHQGESGRVLRNGWVPLALKGAPKGAPKGAQKTPLNTCRVRSKAAQLLHELVSCSCSDEHSPALGTACANCCVHAVTHMARVACIDDSHTHCREHGAACWAYAAPLSRGG
jgi:hypothetical protein